MAKVNVNTATREELLDVGGFKPELVDEILKFRDEKGKIASLDALKELKGVTKTTLEQLRGTLEFGEETGKELAEKATETVETTARAGMDAAKSVASTGARVTSIAARSGVQAIKETADVVGEVEREALHQASEGTLALSKALVGIVNEQTAHNLQLVMALGRARSWGEMVQIQNDFLRASMERLAQLSTRYMEVVRGVVSATASTVKHQADKAA